MIRRGGPDSGFIGVSNEEVSRIARDKTLPSNIRQKAIAEEKRRGLRNTQKRKSNSITSLMIVAGAGAVVLGANLGGLGGGGGCDQLRPRFLIN